MKTIDPFKRGIPLAIAITAIALSAAGNASAKSLVFNATPVSDAVAQIDHELGIHIKLKAGLSPGTLVSFSVDDLSGPGAQLYAVNQLAYALGADYQKTFIVSKVIADSAIVVPKIDAQAVVVFDQTTLPAEKAIDLVAAVDNAQVQYYTPVHGNVTMSATRLTPTEAARQIAQQTHTQWKAYYGLSKRGKGPAQGTVIGYSAGGRPITELPLLSFQTLSAPPAPDATTVTTVPVDATTPMTPAQQAAALANGVYPYPPGYNQYGYPSAPPYGGGGLVFGQGGISVYPGSSPYGAGGPIVISGP